MISVLAEMICNNQPQTSPTRGLFFCYLRGRGADLAVLTSVNKKGLLSAVDCCRVSKVEPTLKIKTKARLSSRANKWKN